MALGWTAWMDAFCFIPGSMGETSALACAIGAGVLIATGIGSWRTMLGVTIGTAAMVLVLNAFGSDTNPAFAMPVWWHMVVGGWAFGTVFMATDPVSSSYTEKVKLIYGLRYRCDGCPRSRGQPGLPGRHDARDLVHEHVRAVHRPLLRSSEHQAEDCRTYRGTQYIIGFAAAVCLVCGVVVGLLRVAQGASGRQRTGSTRRRRSSCVAGLTPAGEDITPEEIDKRFADNIQAKLVDLSTGQYADASEDGLQPSTSARHGKTRHRASRPTPTTRRWPGFQTRLWST